MFWRKNIEKAASHGWVIVRSIRNATIMAHPSTEAYIEVSRDGFKLHGGQEEQEKQKVKVQPCLADSAIGFQGV